LDCGDVALCRRRGLQPQRGNGGWELASVIHANATKNTAEENILAPEGWSLIFKQPAQ
jgi:hypothetical protein